MQAIDGGTIHQISGIVTPHFCHFSPFKELSPASTLMSCFFLSVCKQTHLLRRDSHPSYPGWNTEWNQISKWFHTSWCWLLYFITFIPLWQYVSKTCGLLVNYEKDIVVWWPSKGLLSVLIHTSACIGNILIIGWCRPLIKYRLILL